MGWMSFAKSTGRVAAGGSLARSASAATLRVAKAELRSPMPSHRAKAEVQLEITDGMFTSSGPVSDAKDWTTGRKWQFKRAYAETELRDDYSEPACDLSFQAIVNSLAGHVAARWGFGGQCGK